MIGPNRPQGHEELKNLADMAQASHDAHENGVEKDLLIMMVRITMPDTPLLAVGVSACLDHHF